MIIDGQPNPYLKLYKIHWLWLFHFDFFFLAIFFLTQIYKKFINEE